MENFHTSDELTQWQKEILDHRLLLLQQQSNSVTPLETFLAEMESEAEEECERKD